MSPLSEATRLERALVRSVLDREAALAESDRIVLELHEVHGRSLRQIGALIGYSHAGVAKIVERARRNGG